MPDGHRNVELWWWLEGKPLWPFLIRLKIQQIRFLQTDGPIQDIHVECVSWQILWCFTNKRAACSWGRSHINASCAPSLQNLSHTGVMIAFTSLSAHPHHLTITFGVPDCEPLRSIQRKVSIAHAACTRVCLLFSSIRFQRTGLIRMNAFSMTTLSWKVMNYESSQSITEGRGRDAGEKNKKTKTIEYFPKKAFIYLIMYSFIQMDWSPYEWMLMEKNESTAFTASGERERERVAWRDLHLLAI